MNLANMKYFTNSLLYLLLSLYVIKGHSQKTNFMRDTLNGQIKSIQFKTYKLNNKLNDNNIIELDINYNHSYSDGATYLFTFDKNGNNTFEQDWNNNFVKKFNDKNQIIERLTYTLGNETTRKLLKKTTYLYENDNVKSEKHFSYTSGNECLFMEFVFEYDNNHNTTAIITNNFECGIQKYSTREERKYNLNNKIIEKKTFNRFSGQSTTVEFIYDSKNNLIKEIQRNGSENQIEKLIIFENIKKDNSKNKTEFDKNNTLVKKEIEKLDKNKKLIEKIIYLKDVLELKWINFYRGNRLQEQEYYKKEILFYKKVFSYDVKGNIVECTYYDDKNIVKRKYELKIEYY